MQLVLQRAHPYPRPQFVSNYSVLLRLLVPNQLLKDIEEEEDLLVTVDAAHLVLPVRHRINLS